MSVSSDNTDNAAAAPVTAAAIASAEKQVVFADPHATWVHIDPRTGTVLGRTDTHRRTSRWLFSMLHSWDWLPLLERRPLWDVVLIVLSLGGTALSVTGVVVGWRRLRVKARSGAKAAHPRTARAAAERSQHRGPTRGLRPPRPRLRRWQTATDAP